MLTGCMTDEDGSQYLKSDIKPAVISTAPSELMYILVLILSSARLFYFDFKHDLHMYLKRYVFITQD